MYKASKNAHLHHNGNRGDDHKDCDDVIIHLIMKLP